MNTCLSRTLRARLDRRRIVALIAALGVLVALPVTVATGTAQAAGTIDAPVFGPATTSAAVGMQAADTPAGAACGLPAVITQLFVQWNAGGLAGARLYCFDVQVAGNAVSLGTESYPEGVGGTGSSFYDQSTCQASAGYVMVGMRATSTADHVNGLGLLCQQLAADGTLAGPDVPAAFRGLNSGSQTDVRCAPGSVVTGLTANVEPLPDDNTSLVHSLRLVCQQLTFHTPEAAPDPANTVWPKATDVSDGGTGSGAFSAPGEARWFKVAVAPGTKLHVGLAGVDSTYDLSVFSDIGKQFDTLTSTDDLTRISAELGGASSAPSAFSALNYAPSAFSDSAYSPSAFSPSAFSDSASAPSAFSPSAFSPSAFSPSAFSGLTFSPSAFSPSAFSPSAFSPSAFSPSAFSTSDIANAYSSAQVRSLVDWNTQPAGVGDTLDVSTWNGTGYFYVRVGNRGTSASTAPFTLSVTSSGSTCAGLQTYSSAGTLSGAGSTARTVILTDTVRQPGTPVALSALSAKLSTLATSTRGVVVDVSTSAQVRALDTQADSRADCPYAKNLVGQAIRDIVNSYRAGGVHDVVIVGDDSVIPFFRYPDQAGLGPESDYEPPVADRTSSQSALRTSQTLSQDAYGAAYDLTVDGSTLPVQDLAVGRLVETPQEISATIEDYLALDAGTLPTPTSSLVTGYDFLADSADAVAADLSAGIAGGRNSTLVYDSGSEHTQTSTVPVGARTPTPWTATDLRSALLGTHHDIAYLAGHFSANNTLAADDKTTMLTSDLASAPAGILKGTLVLSAGCHSGYDIVDGHAVASVTQKLDWPQAFAQQGATLIAGTGYQYGDTDFLLYSEQLYSGVSHALREGHGAVAVGSALLAAKQDYLQQSTKLDGITQKALLEATLYGLPMLGVDLPTGRVEAPAPTSTVDPSPVPSGPGQAGDGGLGLQSAPIDLSPALSTRTKPLQVTGGGSLTATYVTGPAGVASGPAEPVLPLVSTDVTGKDADGSALVLRGLGWRSGTYTDTPGVTPLTGAPATDYDTAHGPFAPSTFFPERLATVNYFGALADGSADGATLLKATPVQYRADTPGSSTSTQRTFSTVGLVGFYSANTGTFRAGQNSPARSAPPAISGTDAGVGAGSVSFSTHVTGNPAAGMQSVWVTYTGESGSPLHGNWASVDLTQSAADSTVWTGTLALPAGQSAADVRFLVQAVNGVGLVGVDDNVGAYYTPGAIGVGSAPTSLQVAAPLAASAARGGSLAVSARLSGAGAGALVSFGLGGATVSAPTDGTGTARTNLPLVVAPGTYDLTASYAGSSTAAASSTVLGSVTVTKAPTVLAVAHTTSTSPVGVSLTSGGTPLSGKTVLVGFTDSHGAALPSAAVTTDGQGSATVAASEVPAGAAQVTAYFGTQTVPLPGGASTTLVDDSYAAAATTLVLVSPQGPGIGLSTLPRGVVGAPYSTAVPTTGSPAPTVTVSGLPAGLSLTGSAAAGYRIVGTPTATASATVQLTATNASGSSTVRLPLSVGVATLSLVSGGGQGTPAGTAFARPLVVRATGPDGQGVAGLAVTVRAPTSGASATFAPTTAVTDASGTATSATPRANSTVGNYPVQLAAPGGTSVVAHLANQYVVGTFAGLQDPGPAGGQVVGVNAVVGLSFALRGAGGALVPDAQALALAVGCRVRISVRPAAGGSAVQRCVPYLPSSDRFAYVLSRLLLGYGKGSYVVTVSVSSASGASLGSHTLPVRFS